MMDTDTISEVLQRLDPERRFIDKDSVVESFGEPGGPCCSFIHIPFTERKGADRNPLDIEVVLSLDDDEASRTVGSTNFADEALAAFSDEPDHYRPKAKRMAEELRKLADRLDQL